ncbi:ATP synthase subunit s, mitochondrial-like isoform X3 [Corticium candelabrum]|uniref:ATP synthase subunit s, mitochondrial-like isoform X3 n=1 Tax=Corticium candelabrum TaxID=121492 RepID=UPI002E253717|nr:ATP synthase subunit s, mitochondrial-like isoform X3 [Corticium candelabrum]
MRLFVLKSLRLPLPRRMGYDWNRCFYSWMNFVFNKVDYGRLEEIGPDKIAAEWVVRCGGSIRFQGYERWEKDYNLLPHGTQGRFLLTDIDASNTRLLEYIGTTRMHRSHRERVVSSALSQTSEIPECG